MFVMWRLAKLLVKLALLAALAIVALVVWGDFWPAPHDAPTVPCPEHEGFRCVRLSGRVLFHTSLGTRKRGHLILMSRSSTTLPGVAVLEFPRLNRTPSGLGLGDWITVTGQRTIGSHHEHDLHVWAFATSSEEVRCADPRVADYCHRVKRMARG